MDLEKTNKQIEELNKILDNLKSLDQENDNVKENIKLIQDKITDLKLSTNELYKYIPLHKRFMNNIFNSKTIAINIAWLICECLNSFTDIFQSSNNSFIITIRTIVPSLTIFLRSIK